MDHKGTLVPLVKAVELATATPEPLEAAVEIAASSSSMAGAFRKWQNQQLNKMIAPVAYYHVIRYLRFFSWRVMVSTAVFHSSKIALRALLRRTRHPRLVAVVDFVSDGLLPTPFFGPAIGIAVGVTQLKGPGSKGPDTPPPEGGSNSGAG